MNEKSMQTIISRFKGKSIQEITAIAHSTTAVEIKRILNKPAIANKTALAFKRNANALLRELSNPSQDFIDYSKKKYGLNLNWHYASNYREYEKLPKKAIKGKKSSQVKTPSKPKNVLKQPKSSSKTKKQILQKANVKVLTFMISSQVDITNAMNTYNYIHNKYHNSQHKRMFLTFKTNKKQSDMIVSTKTQYISETYDEAWELFDSIVRNIVYQDVYDSENPNYDKLQPKSLKMIKIQVW